ncbi:hypothetical protein AVEN_202764-1, partial [Araneus ventricosus]
MPGILQNLRHSMQRLCHSCVRASDQASEHLLQHVHVADVNILIKILFVRCLQLQLTAILGLFSCVLGAGDIYYRAAVLEPVHFSDLTHSATDVVKRNLDIYETAVKTAAIN